MLRTKQKDWIALWQPHSFVGLMSLYEGNHLRLKRLLGGIVPEPGESLVSCAAGDLPLHADGLEHSRYTTTLRLTYWFEYADPDLVLRIYHDAGLVEVMQCVNHPRHSALQGFAPSRGGELERRWTRNLMLHKWLDYCHERGHRFGPVELPAAEPLTAGLR